VPIGSPKGFETCSGRPPGGVILYARGTVFSHFLLIEQKVAQPHTKKGSISTPKATQRIKKCGFVFQFRQSGALVLLLVFMSGSAEIGWGHEVVLVSAYVSPKL
jgi:hypothetical protein